MNPPNPDTKSVGPAPSERSESNGPALSKPGVSSGPALSERSESNGFVFARAKSIAIKEVRHVLRDPFTLGLALGLPLLMVLFFGLAMDFNVKDIHVTVFDRDHTHASRKLVEVLESSNYFLVAQGCRPRRPAKDVDADQAKAAIVIEPEFEKNWEPVPRLGTGLDRRVRQLHRRGHRGLPGRHPDGGHPPPDGPTLSQPVSLRTRYLFNPELNSRWFTVPGLSAVVLAIISIMLTALTVAREWENGSMELLLSTPVHPLEIIVGKLGPYVVLGLIAQTLIYLAARLYFGVPFEGSHLVFLAGALLFVSAYMALGLLVSVTTRNQAVAMQFSLLIGMLPSLMLSGFIFPIENMPMFFQYFSGILPARWFMVIIRGVFLRGATLTELAGPFAALLIINVIFIRLAVSRFKKDLEP
jgi:ABC-2 type transport system permease protein